MRGKGRRCETIGTAVAVGRATSTKDCGGWWWAAVAVAVGSTRRACDTTCHCDNPVSAVVCDEVSLGFQ